MPSKCHKRSASRKKKGKEEERCGKSIKKIKEQKGGEIDVG
jgi:hypothetical protein